MAFSQWPCREVEVLEEEDVRGDRGLSVFRLRAVSRLTLVVRCTEIGYSVSTQVLGFRFGCGWCCVVGFLFGCCWFCVLLLCVSAWWNRGILDEVTKASYGRAVTGTAVMARSANEEKKKKISSTPAFRQGPRSGEALDGAIRVAAPLTYANEDTVHLQQSHFLKLPNFEGIYGKITRNVPSPPDEHVVRWLRAQAPRLPQRDEGDKSAIPLGLYISLPQVVELIKARHSNEEKSVQLMRHQFRNNKVELRIPRLPHPLHAVLTQQALASGVQPPPTPAAPHIAPLPEGFELDPPVTSQLHQPASARGQAPKRPAPETPASPVFEGLPSGPLSPAPPQPILYPLVRSPSYCLSHTSRGPPL